MASLKQRKFNLKWISWCLFFTLALMYSIGNKSQSFVFFSFISSLGHFGDTQVFVRRGGCFRRADISTWTHGWGIECALVQTHSWPLACCLEELNVVFVIFFCRPLSQPLTVPLCSYCFSLLHTTCNAPTGLWQLSLVFGSAHKKEFCVASLCVH